MARRDLPARALHGWGGSDRQELQGNALLLMVARVRSCMICRSSAFRVIPLDWETRECGFCALQALHMSRDCAESNIDDAQICCCRTIRLSCTTRTARRRIRWLRLASLSRTGACAHPSAGLREAVSCTFWTTSIRCVFVWLCFCFCFCANSSQACLLY